MPAHEFAVGDIISLMPDTDTDTTNNLGRCKAVVVSTLNQDGHVLAVFLDGKVASHLVREGCAVAKNRGWHLYPGDYYYPQLEADPTDEEVAMAMRILLTGYVPGVDDE